MKCNYKRSATKGKDVYKNIYENLSYEELLVNTAGVLEDNMPCVPSNTRSLMVYSKIDMLLFDVKKYYFVDVTDISAINKNGEKKLVVPITIPLLALYGITSQQFIDDFTKQSVTLMITDNDEKVN